MVVMGVAGCGKSSLGLSLARDEGLPLIEGDDHHSADNKARMQAGVALTDADRQGWLAALGAELAARPQGAVLTCSALKRSYRDLLRAARPGLRFAYLEIDRQAARQRVAARSAHFFSPALVDSQFTTLEPPTGEPGVLTLDARAPLATLTLQVQAWLHGQTT